MKIKQTSIFILSVDLIILLMLIFIKVVYEVNPIFVEIRAIEMVLVSLACLYVFNLEENGNIPLHMVLLSAFLIFVAVSLTYITSLIPDGSIILLMSISVISGTVVYLIFGRRVPPLNELYVQNKKAIESIGFSGYSILILIFLLGFSLRLLVFGLPSVPLGYDTPAYLHLARENMNLGIFDLLKNGLWFSGDAYQDNWNFAGLWLGICAKILDEFNMDLIYIPKFFIVFINSLSIIVVFFLAKELTNKTDIANYSALIFAILPAELIFSDLYKEIFGELFVILSLFLFIKLCKKRSYFTLICFFFSMFFLWKIAITAFAKAVMFLLAYSTYLYLTENISKKEKKIIFVLILMGISFFVLYGAPFELRPVKVADVGIYTQYSFPILALTNFTAFLVTIFLSFKVINKLSPVDRLVFPFSATLLLSIFIYSFMISGLMSYRIFPSTTLLNSLRFSLYMDIPLSIMVGLFIYKVKTTTINMKYLVIAIVLACSLADFALTSWDYTTIHSNRLKPYISEEDYFYLNSIQYDGYEEIYVIGNFTWSSTTSNFAVGNWIKYIIYSKSGKDAVFVQSLDEVDENDRSLIIDYNPKNIKSFYRS